MILPTIGSALKNNINYDVLHYMKRPDFDEVVIYQFPLLAQEEELELAQKLLSKDERRRAERFTLKSARQRYTICRAEVRRILSQITGRDAHQLEIVYGENRKPILAKFGKSFTFNITHSSDLALLAVSRGVEIGIDVEQIRSLDDLDSIANLVFSVHEQDTLRLLPDSIKLERFYRFWIHKEALLKGMGYGLSIPANDLDLVKGSILLPNGNISTLSSWSIYDLNVPSGFMAALATRSPVTITETPCTGSLNTLWNNGL